MAAKITTLIDSTDGFERVGEQIAAILLLESQGQQQLASTAGRDASGWKLRVFYEGSNPWSEWIDPPEDTTFDTSPIINVSFDKADFPKGKGNVAEQQQGEGVWNIDCYGYGLASAQGSSQTPGEVAAALERNRAVRLVRRILMAGRYTYLDMRGVVGRRWPLSIQTFTPKSNAREAQNIQAARIALEVSYNETSPQVQGAPLNMIGITFKRAPDGELTYFQADFPQV